jgi:hypothetical protein
MAALKRANPIIKRFHDAHEVTIAGGVYAIATGRIEFL